ncbi:MAG: TerC family protein [Saprospiraceae bacterium]|nr:TerC family protein [Saprospiraceae bacterium]HRG69968.1 TerC family protein [Saprospiraceae bacterium]
MFEMPDFGSFEIIMSFLTLTFLEIVLGVDNIIFISITASRLNDADKKKATRIGLLAAMVLRIILLFGLSFLTAMQEPIFIIEQSWLHAGFSIQSIILIAGGIFLMYKSVTEIHHKLESDSEMDHAGTGNKMSLTNAVIQISLINLIFSLDSILTAVGMTNGLQGALWLMVIAVVASILIMMAFASPVGKFVNDHPTIQMLGLSFLILIGFMLIAEGSHLAHLHVGTNEVGTIPKGYLYFAIAFSLLVEFLNMRLRKKVKPVQLHGIEKEAKKIGYFNKENK